MKIGTLRVGSAGVFCLVLLSCASQGLRTRPASVAPAAPGSVCPECEQAMTREDRGFRDDRFSEQITLLLKRYRRPLPDEDFRIDSHLFLSAMRTIVARDPALGSPLPAETNRDQVAVSLAVFQSFRAQLESAFHESFAAPAEEAAALASVLVLEARQLARLPPAPGESDKQDRARTRLVRSLAERLWASSRIESRTDVPYIAGYAEGDPRWVFIDRSIPAEGKLKGKRVPAHFLLNVHERVEKLLLDRFGLSYQHAHQIAQRSERRAALSFGLSWSEYDSWLGRAAARVAEERPLRVHPELDMTCYRSYVDEENIGLLREMEEAKRRWPN